MKLTSDGKGNVSFPTSELIELMTDEQKMALTHYALWDDALMEMVVGRLKGDVIWDGWYQAPDRVIEKLQVALIDEYPAIARACVKRLMTVVAEARTEAKRSDDWARSMEMAWPEAYWSQRPDRPKWVSTPYPTDVEIDAELAKPE